MEEIQLKLHLSCYSLPHSDGRRLQITIQYPKKKKTTCPCFHLCYKHVGVLLVMEECCSSLHAPPPSLPFPISKNSTSIHPVSQPGNRCLFASLSLSSPTQSPINFPPHLSHHHHSPLLFTWWIYSVTSSLNSLQLWPFSIPSSLIATVIFKKKKKKNT